MPDSCGLDVPGFRGATKRPDEVRAEVEGAVKGTQILLDAAFKGWDGAPVTRQFTEEYNGNVQKLIDAAGTVLGFVADAGGRRSIIRSRKRTTAAAVHFGGKVSRIG
jgi:hypothetical protein